MIYEIYTGWHTSAIVRDSVEGRRARSTGFLGRLSRVFSGGSGLPVANGEQAFAARVSSPQGSVRSTAEWSLAPRRVDRQFPGSAHHFLEFP